jgi:hypothetical protein
VKVAGNAIEKPIERRRTTSHDRVRSKRPASYPDNGRTLSDDVMDVFVSIITNGKVTRDNVGHHNDLLASFPYLGPPHKVRSAEPAPA